MTSQNQYRKQRIAQDTVAVVSHCVGGGMLLIKEASSLLSFFQNVFDFISKAPSRLHLHLASKQPAANINYYYSLSGHRACLILRSSHLLLRHHRPFIIIISTRQSRLPLKYRSLHLLRPIYPPWPSRSPNSSPALAPPQWVLSSDLALPRPPLPPKLS